MAGKESVTKLANNEEKKKALDAAIAKLEKDFGKGAVMRLGESGAHVAVETVPTGCLSLDLALGLGGVPKGRVIEVYGPESSGKTTVALHMISEVQKRGGIAGFIDAEHALDPVYAKNIGVDIDELYISQPDSGDQALEIAETMVRSGAIDIIVIDSVAALVPKQEIEGDMGDSHVGLQARLMSQALRKLTPVISKSNCIVIFINQLREKVGVMFGNPETTTGGRALKFYASVRMDVRRIETLKQSGEMVGNRTRIRIVKNKIAPPFKEAEFEKLCVYSKRPEKLDVLETSLQKIFGNDVELSTSDTLYQQMSAPLEQISKVANLMLVLTLVTGTVVVSLLLCMWMRTRQKEVAIFMSLGKTKSEIFLQTLLEAGSVFTLSVLGATAIGKLFSGVLQNVITGSETVTENLKVVLQIQDIGMLFLLGGAVILVALCCSILPILRANPKDILAKMEG